METANLEKKLSYFFYCVAQCHAKFSVSEAATEKINATWKLRQES